MQRNTVALTMLITRDWLSEWWCNNGSDGKATKNCSNDGVNTDDVRGGDGKRKVDCGGEADDDGDNDKADCDDDAYSGGGGNSKDDGDEDGIFENWCVDEEGGDEADDGDEQT